MSPGGSFSVLLASLADFYPIARIKSPGRIRAPPIPDKCRVFALVRNWWYTCPPRSPNSSIWVKSLRAMRAVLKKYLTARETFLSLVVQRGKLYGQKTRNEFFAFHTIEHRARF